MHRFCPLTRPTPLAMLRAMSRTPTLWGLSVSPWSEKARWALDHHAVAYRYREHTPLLGEPALRWRARGRAPGTKATVPLLLDGPARIVGSDAIAHHVERTAGQAAPLFSPAHAAAITDWERAGDAGLHAARVLLAEATLASPEALVEQLPPLIPGPLRRPLRPLARSGMAYVARKHDAGPEQIAASTRTLTDLAERIRAELDANGRYLLGDQLSWADVCAAMVVNGFAGGVPGRFSTLPATAQTWRRPELTAEFADLIAWRDSIYAQHRPASAQLLGHGANDR